MDHADYGVKILFENIVEKVNKLMEE